MWTQAKAAAIHGRRIEDVKSVACSSRREAVGVHGPGCDGLELVQQREVNPKEEMDDTRNTKDPRIGEITEYT